MFGPDVSSNIIKKENPVKHGRSAAKGVNNFFDRQFTKKGSEFTQLQIAIFMHKFAKAFIDELLKDSPKNRDRFKKSI